MDIVIVNSHLARESSSSTTSSIPGDVLDMAGTLAGGWAREMAGVPAVEDAEDISVVSWEGFDDADNMFDELVSAPVVPASDISASDLSDAGVVVAGLLSSTG